MLRRLALLATPDNIKAYQDKLIVLTVFLVHLVTLPGRQAAKIVWRDKAVVMDHRHVPIVSLDSIKALQVKVHVLIVLLVRSAPLLGPRLVKIVQQDPPSILLVLQDVTLALRVPIKVSRANCSVWTVLRVHLVTLPVQQAVKIVPLDKVAVLDRRHVPIASLVSIKIL